MPKAKTVREEKHEHAKEKDDAKRAARDAYWKDQKKPKSERRTLTAIAHYYGVAPSTLHALVNGRPTIKESNEMKQLLSTAEETALVKYLIRQAKRGFPLTPRMVVEKVVAILEAKSGEPMEVGHEWFMRFMHRQPALQTYRAGPLDRARANAAYEQLMVDYADTVEEVYERIKPPQRNVFGTDEVGLNGALAPRQTVVGPANQRQQKKQQLGDRDNITCIETICGDGLYLRPLVIFKGINVHARWADVNPDDAKLVYDSILRT